MYRIGTGWDIHELIPSSTNDLIIGGVRIKTKISVLAHSDGDALLHAIIDALLGAVAMGDIGQHFPDTDMNYRDISSLELLKKAKDIVLAKYPNMKIVNIDSTVILQTPKLSPYIDSIKETISNAVEIEKNAVSVKAKTAENLLGKLGLGQAIEAQVSMLIEI